MWSTASPEDATISFAKAARRSKSESESPFEVSDLTAALSQIQGHAGDDLYFEFKVPADPGLFASDTRTSAADVEAIKMLVESIDLLLEWKWAESISLGKQILSKTDTESIRDEALNVMAAGLALSGDIEAGIAALKKAAEGEWNLALQQNLGILALKVDPELAANQSTYWLDAADSAEDRESAIFFVLKMWSSWEDDAGFELPVRIRDSFRTAIQRELSLSTFSMLGLFLARNDSEWLQDSSNWDSSPNFGTEVADMVIVRAEGMEEFIDYLAEHAASTDSEIVRARSNFISQLIDAMMGEESAIGAVSYAITLVERGLPCDSMNNAMLRALAVREICLYLRENDGEPKDAFLDWLVEVQRFNESLTDKDLREFLDEILSKASTLFILGYVGAREREFAQFIDPLSTVYSMSQRWSTKRRLNKSQARELAKDMLGWSNQVKGVLDKMRRLPVTDQIVTGFVVDFSGRREGVTRMASEILSSL